MIRNKDNLAKISYYLAAKTDNDAEVLLFGLRLIMTTVLGYILLIVFSLPFKATGQTLVAALTVSCFRIFSGGAHATAPSRCSLIGVLVLVPIGIVAKKFGFLLSPYLAVLVFAIFAIGLIVIFRYVPADTPGKPINSAVQRKYLRVISYTILVLWSLGSYLCFSKKFGLESGFVMASILGMFWQLYTLTPAGYSTYKLLDNLLNFNMKGGLR